MTATMMETTKTTKTTKTAVVAEAKATTSL
jgi:hypothetical protein